MLGIASSSPKRWRPRWTLRLRLTLLYGSLFLMAGAVLLGITYGLVADSIPAPRFSRDVVISSSRTGKQALPALPPAGAFQAQVGPGGAGLNLVVRAYKGTIRQLNAKNAATIRALQKRATVQLSNQRSAELDSLLTKSAVALGIMAILSIGLGWLIAGRALRPVRTMSARARGISERNLHERLAVDGPNDELKELGDTFDDVLARLETAFESQRRFVSNASHELRTPITLERTLVEVALADPGASVESLKDTCRRVLAAGEQQERLIEALLTLARGQRGLASREEVDLGQVAGGMLRGIDANGVRLESELGEAETAGDRRLIERLLTNLLDNALKYNEENGWVQVWTGMRDGRPALAVANTGPVIAPDRIGELLEPFRRLNGDRSGNGEAIGCRGLGLGLSIVDAIATAHGATLRASSRQEGGLRVEVSFPACPGPSLD